MCCFCKALPVGSKAPDFSLPDQQGNLRTLSEYKGRYVVLYFYLKDNTSVCTAEACQLRDNFDEFRKENIAVLGVDYESPESHKAFAQQHHLPFVLLSDSKKEVAKKYGVKRWWWFSPFPYRVTFIIDPQGLICSVLKNIDAAKQPIQILSMIQQHRQDMAQKRS